MTSRSSPANKALVEALLAVGVPATIYQFERLRRAELVPPLVALAGLTPEIVQHYADAVWLTGQGRDRVGVPTVLALRGHPVKDAVLQTDFAAFPQIIDFASSEFPVGGYDDSDGAFEDAERYARRMETEISISRSVYGKLPQKLRAAWPPPMESEGGGEGDSFLTLLIKMSIFRGSGTFPEPQQLARVLVEMLGLLGDERNPEFRETIEATTTASLAALTADIPAALFDVLSGAPGDLIDRARDLLALLDDPLDIGPTSQPRSVVLRAQTAVLLAAMLKHSLIPGADGPIVGLLDPVRRAKT